MMWLLMPGPLHPVKNIISQYVLFYSTAWKVMGKKFSCCLFPPYRQGVPGHINRPWTHSWNSLSYLIMPIVSHQLWCEIWQWNLKNSIRFYRHTSWKINSIKFRAKQWTINVLKIYNLSLYPHGILIQGSLAIYHPVTDQSPHPDKLSFPKIIYLPACLSCSCCLYCLSSQSTENNKSIQKYISLFHMSQK